MNRIERSATGQGRGQFDGRCPKMTDRGARPAHRLLMCEPANENRYGVSGLDRGRCVVGAALDAARAGSADEAQRQCAWPNYMRGVDGDERPGGPVTSGRAGTMAAVSTV